MNWFLLYIIFPPALLGGMLGLFGEKAENATEKAAVVVGLGLMSITILLFTLLALSSILG